MTDTESWLQTIAESLRALERDQGWMPAPPESTFGNVVDGIVPVVAYRVMATSTGNEVQVVTNRGKTHSVSDRKVLTLGDELR